MDIQKEIDGYIASQPEPKRGEMRDLHTAIVQVMPGCKLWFLDGRDSEGKTVSNPSIGYGSYTIKYTDGKTKEFYQVGLSANTGGISVYIMGIEDKKYLSRAYGERLGKASVTGYCIKFKKLNDINPAVLQEAIGYGVAATNEG